LNHSTPRDEPFQRVETEQVRPRFTTQIEGTTVSATGTVSIGAGAGLGSLLLKGIAAGLSEVVLIDAVSQVKAAPAAQRALEITNPVGTTQLALVDQYIEELNDPDPDVRTYATDALALIARQHDPVYETLRAALLDDPSPEQRARLMSILQQQTMLLTYGQNQLHVAAGPIEPIPGMEPTGPIRTMDDIQDCFISVQNTDFRIAFGL
jgi:hypothetical protein